MRRAPGLIVVAMMALAACGGDGGDAVLETLRSPCRAGDMTMCDLLYLSSPIVTQLEAYGDSCGNRNEPAGWCAHIYDVDIDLDDLSDRCLAGDMLGCDLLYMYSPIGSSEEALGASCGGRGESDVTCVMEYGLP